MRRDAQVLQECAAPAQRGTYERVTSPGQEAAARLEFGIAREPLQRPLHERVRAAEQFHPGASHVTTEDAADERHGDDHRDYCHWSHAALVTTVDGGLIDRRFVGGALRDGGSGQVEGHCRAGRWAPFGSSAPAATVASMKALVYYGPGKRSWEDVPDPTLVDDRDAIAGLLLTLGTIILASVILIEPATTSSAGLSD